MQFGALCAPGFFSAEGGDKGCRPFPRTPFSASGLLRFAPDRFLLTKPNTLPHNRVASVATLRWCSRSSRNAVRLPSGTSVQLRRNPHMTFPTTPMPGVGEILLVTAIVLVSAYLIGFVG